MLRGMIPDVHAVRFREGLMARVPACHRGCMAVREREFVIGWLIGSVRGWLPDRVSVCAVAGLVDWLGGCMRVCWRVCVHGCVRECVAAILVWLMACMVDWLMGWLCGWLWA